MDATLGQILTRLFDLERLYADALMRIAELEHDQEVRQSDEPR